MPLFNPWEFARPARKEITRTFVDPEHPEAPITLTLRALDHCDRARAAGAAEEQLDMWVRGSEGQPPMMFPAQDGQPVYLNEQLVYNLSMIEAMQQGAERFSFNALVGLMVAFPSAYEDILECCNDLGKRERGRVAAGNAEGAATGISSERPEKDTLSPSST